MTIDQALQAAHDGQRMGRESWGEPLAYIIGVDATVYVVLVESRMLPMPYVISVGDATADDWQTLNDTQTPPPGP